MRYRKGKGGTMCCVMLACERFLYLFRVGNHSLEDKAAFDRSTRPQLLVNHHSHIPFRLYTRVVFLADELEYTVRYCAGLDVYTLLCLMLSPDKSRVNSTCPRVILRYVVVVRLEKHRPLCPRAFMPVAITVGLCIEGLPPPSPGIVTNERR